MNQDLHLCSPRSSSAQCWVHHGHQTFGVDEWTQMVMDVASCATGPLTCLHHRSTREHMVSRLDWPLSRLQPQGQLGELSNLVHLFHTSLILTAGNFSKDRDPRCETSGSPNLCLEYHLSSCIHELLPKWRKVFSSGCFPYWPFSEPCEPILLE